MKLKELLYEMYSQNPDEDDIDTSLKYAYLHLTYLDEGHELLQTEDILHLGEKRKIILTGEEVIEKGFYTLWSGAHDGIEWLQRHNSLEEANERKEEWDAVKFNSCDFCGILEVK